MSSSDKLNSAKDSLNLPPWACGRPEMAQEEEGLAHLSTRVWGTSKHSCPSPAQAAGQEVGLPPLVLSLSS
jgi:hypothetical protein